jgi:hypothetical protein
MKSTLHLVIVVLVTFGSCNIKKNNPSKPAEQPAFYNLMSNGDTLIIFRKHLYYWNDRGPMGEGRSYNEYIQRFIITKNESEVVYCASIQFEPRQFPDTLKFDSFLTNINLFDDFFDINPFCIDNYSYSEICCNSFPINSVLAQVASEEFQEYEKGWPEYYKLKPSQRSSFMIRQLESDYNFFDVIMHFRGRKKRFYSTIIPPTLGSGAPFESITYPPGQKAIGPLKK